MPAVHIVSSRISIYFVLILLIVFELTVPRLPGDIEGYIFKPLITYTSHILKFITSLRGMSAQLINLIHKLILVRSILRSYFSPVVSI